MLLYFVPLIVRRYFILLRYRARQYRLLVFHSTQEQSNIDEKPLIIAVD